MNIPSYAQIVIEKLENAGFEAYVVGGCVRDSLMGRAPKDWDVCSSATPQESLCVFEKFHTIKTGLQHGTITVMIKREPIEVTTYRLDGNYSDGRHPDAVAFVTNLQEDLARRDFTINAMAYSPQRGLVDCFEGQADLKAGLIRCVGVARERFHEDGLRILRALRFASRFEFDIEAETAQAVRDCRHLLTHVSVERIFVELKGILEGAGAGKMLREFPEVFCEFIPELKITLGFKQENPHHSFDVWEHTIRSIEAAPADAILRLTMLLHDLGKPECFTQDAEGKGHFYGHNERGAEIAKKILRRLKSDNDTKHTISRLVGIHDCTLPTSMPGMRRFIGKHGAELIRQLFTVKRSDYSAQSQLRREEKMRLICEAEELLESLLRGSPSFTVRDLNIGGRELMELGLKPGPAIKEILDTLLAEVQDELLENDPQKLQARAAELLARA